MLELSKISIAQLEQLNACKDGKQKFTDFIQHKISISPELNKKDITELVKVIDIRHILWYMNKTNNLSLIVKFAEQCAASVKFLINNNMMLLLLLLLLVDMLDMLLLDMLMLLDMLLMLLLLLLLLLLDMQSAI
jgi:hypothetical protein